MLRGSYECNWNPHYNFLHSVLTECNVKPTVTTQCDADQNIHTSGERRIVIENNMSDGETGRTKKQRKCLQSKNSQRYHAK